MVGAAPARAAPSPGRPIAVLLPLQASEPQTDDYCARTPLDPQIAPIVEVVESAAASGPPPSEISVDDHRAGYLALSAFAGAGPAPDHVEDRTIPGPAGQIPVRIYRNEGARGIFVFFHGVGFTIGNLDPHDEVCRQLAVQSGATVMAEHYRLAPLAPFPAGVDDSWAAVQWVDANRVELGGHADAKIVVAGDSAGGNLSAAVALMARDAGLVPGVLRR
jgi:acetyl esterase